MTDEQKPRIENLEQPEQELTPEQAAAASHLPVIIERSAGPCRLWGEQALHIPVFLPAGGPLRRFRLTLLTGEGQLLATREFTLTPGTGTRFLLSAEADGSILFNAVP